jgi:hypothetical protein
LNNALFDTFTSAVFAPKFFSSLSAKGNVRSTSSFKITPLATTMFVPQNLKCVRTPPPAAQNAKNATPRLPHHTKHLHPVLRVTKQQKERKTTDVGLEPTASASVHQMAEANEIGGLRATIAPTGQLNYGSFVVICNII